MNTKLLAFVAISVLLLSACTQQQLDTAVETNEKANQLLEETVQKAKEFEQSVEETTESVGKTVEQGINSVEQSVEQGIQDSFVGGGINNAKGIIDNMNETEQEIEALLEEKE